MWRFLFRRKSFSKQISSSKFLTLSPLQTMNWVLSAWTKHENASGGIAPLSLVIWVTSWNGHILPSQFTYSFVSGRWISAQVFNRSITMVMCSNAQQILKYLKARLTQNVQNITSWGTCTCSGTKGRVPIFPLLWFQRDDIVTALSNEFIKVKGVKFRWNYFWCSWYSLILHQIRNLCMIL